ncbi:MAG TPA: rhomboid family intramembrane serine protease [Anaerolineales bacterium]|nr:rhomboid family intramembrane serine protease [Anaerolineales bacterium]
MFPLRDTVRARTFPVVNWVILAANVVIFILMTSEGPASFERLTTRFALIPSQLSLDRPLEFLTLFSSMFMHGSWFHLLSNMWTLYIFGDNVEDRMGSPRYLLFYLLSGLAAGLVQIYFAPSSQIPTVGASGAIAGVLGAYLLLYPRGRVITLIPLFIVPWFVEIPAFVFLGLWFLSQLSSGLLSLGAVGDFGGIAWWAHVGGFAFGLLTVYFFARRRRAYARWYGDEYWPW